MKALLFDSSICAVDFVVDIVADDGEDFVVLFCC